MWTHSTLSWLLDHGTSVYQAWLVNLLLYKESISKYLQHSLTMNGPDQILPSSTLTNTNPDGCVKIRDNDLRENPPISVIKMFKTTQNKFRSKVALKVNILKYTIYHLFFVVIILLISVL